MYKCGPDSKAYLWLCHSLLIQLFKSIDAFTHIPKRTLKCYIEMLYLSARDFHVRQNSPPYSNRYIFYFEFLIFKQAIGIKKNKTFFLIIFIQVKLNKNIVQFLYLSSLLFFHCRHFDMDFHIHRPHSHTTPFRNF